MNILFIILTYYDIQNIIYIYKKRKKKKDCGIFSLKPNYTQAILAVNVASIISQSFFRFNNFNYVNHSNQSSLLVRLLLTIERLHYFRCFHLKYIR